MTPASTANRAPSAPELELMLGNARRGDATQHGQEQAALITQRMVGAVGAVAALLWGFDLWLAFRHIF